MLTVEPGLYFNNYQIDKGLGNPDQAQYLVKERLENMRTFGGARIEDMVRCNASTSNVVLETRYMTRCLKPTTNCHVGLGCRLW